MTTILFQETLDLFDGPRAPQIDSQLTFKPTRDEDSCVDDEYEFGRQITPFGIGRKSIGQPFDQILEVTAMLHGKERSRILVARFEGLDGRWLCVELFTI